jgi:hypothetical protein
MTWMSNFLTSTRRLGLPRLSYLRAMRTSTQQQTGFELILVSFLLVDQRLRTQRTSMKFLPSVLVLAAALSVHASSSASTVALEWTTGGSQGSSAETRGYAFALNSSINVTGLGWFDLDGDGLVDSHEVGVWSSAGTLVMSGTVSAGTVDPLTGHFRYTSSIFGATLLDAGTYVVAGLSTADDATWRSIPLADVTLAPQVSYIGNRTNGSTGVFSFAGAAQNGFDVGYFGANFTFDPVDTVPEPSGILLTLTACAAIWASRRGAGTA